MSRPDGRSNEQSTLSEFNREEVEAATDGKALIDDFPAVVLERLAAETFGS